MNLYPDKSTKIRGGDKVDFRYKHGYSYKFKDWNKHSSNGKTVLLEEKQKRAEEIARDLSNNSIWHSHGRSIGIDALTSSLKLKIEDYSRDDELRELIRNYNDLICEYILRTGNKAFVHSRVFF